MEGKRSTPWKWFGFFLGNSWGKKRRRVKLSMIWGKILNPLLCVCVCDSRPQSCLTLCDPKDYSSSGSSVHGISQARITGMGGYSLLQGIFPTQGSNPHLLHCRQILYQLSHKGSKRFGSLSLLQWIFPTQEFNWGFLH